MQHAQHVHGFEFRNHLAGCPELNATLGGETRQCLHKLEDARLAHLQLAEGLVGHKQVHHLLLLRQRGNPVEILVGGKRITGPLAVAEAERDVVAQLGVLEQQFEFGSRGGIVDIVRRLPAQDVLGALGNHALVAHAGHHGGNIVVIDKLSVAQHLGMLAKELVNLLLVSLDLCHKLLGVLQRSQRMGIGLAQELHAAGGGEFFHRVDELGHILLKLLQRATANGKRHLEFLAVRLNHVEKHLVGGQVTATSNARDDVIIGKVIIVIMVVTNVEEAVGLQAERLVYLKIETNRFHYSELFID